MRPGSPASDSVRRAEELCDVRPKERVPVLIVGAGAAGLSLSLLLRQQGIGSVLVEQRADVPGIRGARNLNFRTLEVFRGLGLERQVIAAGSPVSRVFHSETLAWGDERKGRC